MAQQRAAEREAAEREAAELAAQREAARQEEQAAELAAQQEAERLARQRAAEQLEQEPVAADPTATGQRTAPEEPSNTAAPRPSSGGGGSGGASASAVVAEAEKYLGVPYRYGGADPSGFDCSGLTMYVYSEFGISLPHSAAGQFGYGSPGSGAAGDLVFGDYTGSGEIGHVGIATGDGQMINAPYPGTVVRYDPIPAGQQFVGYRTLL